MAWYALYKWFSTFRKQPAFNWISWYRGYLYKEWFDSLSEEDQIKELARKRAEEKHNQECLNNFLCMGAMLNGYMQREGYMTEGIDLTLHKSKYW